MVLVDSSVWIRALAGMVEIQSRLDRLLAQGAVGAHEFVEGELSMGDTGRRAKALADYRFLTYLPMVAHRDVRELVRIRGLAGRGLGWIDVHLLASALASRSELWSTDRALAAAACELGIAF